jgi:glutathione S-transferase
MRVRAQCPVPAARDVYLATVLLYDSRVSGNCYKVRLLFSHLGIEEVPGSHERDLANAPTSAPANGAEGLLFAHLGLRYQRRELSVVDRSNREQVLGELNPARRVPTLVLDDGRVLAESDAILWYFAEGTPYLPDERFERAKVLQWLFFEQYDHEPTLAVVRFWVAFSSSPPPPAEMEARRAAGYRALDAMERVLREAPYLVGGHYTIADIALYAYTHVAAEGGFDLSGYPGIGAWLDRVAAQERHIPIDA